ncbi:putative outer membrane protein, probably involved in in nutrient binding protein [Indibacter alkaliphilus LW1]|jgi:tetratricopeptide (TPR) repeat protein|uniref:Outer membrane protein, probably involved in in nutrient binding protein n=1 Tax=Indibacter alkaliphilus (strain CCUG 57479 / KCTC 22604 / LW1) TaxID=1189612 RepID=S2D8G1_INDAL|nr:RagB/SusD family nutrient uptake outer membrane protein [Indibacter alkaliphilus]EOZ95204.1 putative outer membrane protein, probably involved in in nutrient binding protein [Indibacter alkaliphilus LW1]
MKKFKFQIAAALTAGIMLVGTSCEDFLDVPVVGQLSEAQLTSLEGIDATLIGAYSQVNGRDQRMSSPSNWVWGSIRGGDANKGTDPGDFATINPIQRFEANPTIDVIENNWQGLYEGIARANSTLRLLAMRGEDVSDAQAANIEGQARFLRGHYYFELWRNYNRVPIMDVDNDYGTEGFNELRNDQDVLPFVIADFQFAVDNLPATQAQVGRVNSWAAKSYLAKVYMYQQRFSDAKQLFDDIIANGVTSNGLSYGLVPYYDDMFRGANDNHQESIWAYQSAAGTGSVNNANPEFDLNFPYNTGPNGPGNCCGFFQPSFSFVNSFRTNAQGLPLIDNSFNQPANRVANDQGINSDQPFTPDAGNLDPRLDHTVGRRGIPYLDWQDHPGQAWIRNQPNGGPYSPKKYVYQRAEEGTFQDNASWTPGYTGINIMIIRFADVLLMAAEAEVELGNLERARELVNRVRERAVNSKLLRDDGSMAANYVVGLYESAWTDANTARTAVRFERKLELGMEGQRFYDLVRWGIAKEELDFYFAHDAAILVAALGGSSFTPGRDELLPIPQFQIDLMGDRLVQNPGFN